METKFWFCNFVVAPNMSHGCALKSCISFFTLPESITRKRFSKVLRKMNVWNFSVFCMKLHQYKGLKLLTAVSNFFLTVTIIISLELKLIVQKISGKTSSVMDFLLQGNKCIQKMIK